MNKFPIIITALVAALLAGGFGYWLANTNSPQMTATEAGDAQEEKPLFYRNPMNPAITSPVAAKDEMGMDYIPVYADSSVSASVPGTVAIDPVTTQSIGVRTTMVERRSLSRVIRTIGKIDYNEESITRLHPKTEGWIEEMRIGTTGQTIEKDDILLSIYSPQLVSAQQEYLLTRGQSSGASQDLTKTSLQRLELFDVPAHQIAELKRTGEVKKYLHIHSPASGTVITVGARNGQFVTPKTELYFIADLGSVWVYVDIFEDELPWVRVGDKAEVKLKGIPGRTFSGTLTYIYPYADRKTRTIKARLEFDNPELALKPELFADVRIFTQERESAIVIPTEAIVRTGTREKVFVLREPGKFEPRVVTLGVSSEGFTEVLNGVEIGEQIVTSAQFLIDSESKLREAVSKMMAPKKKDPMNEDGMDHSKMDHGMHGDEHSKMKQKGVATDGSSSNHRMDKEEHTP